MTSDASTILLHRTASSTRTEARRLQRLARTGSLTRVRPGVFADAESVAELDERQQHVLLVRALLPRVPPGALLSHLSAVAVFDWPHIGSWPSRVHLTDQVMTSTLHRNGFTVHRRLTGPVPTSTRSFEGVMLLSAAATAVESARTLTLPESVVVLDHVLRNGLSDPSTLTDRVERTAERGRVAAARAVRCASARRESVGESYLAARMIEIGAPTFEEQHQFRSGDGTIDRVDFWLPELGIVVEFDGRQKYEDQDMLRGRSGEDVLWEEKRREDRLRARPDVRGVIRVRWWHLVDPDRLRALFREHGVPLARRPRG